MLEVDRITSILQEDRHYPPPKHFASLAHIRSPEQQQEIGDFANRQPETFWAEQAGKLLHWFAPWGKVFEQEEAFQFRWFKGGKINASYNCLDRHLEVCPEKPAIIWEGEPGDTCILSYRNLWECVCQVANAFIALGVGTNDIVTLYMPMVPELTICVLACARIGVMHNVVFAGFSSEALATRLDDAQSRFVVTADGGFRKGQPLPLKATVDQALMHCPFVTKVVVLERTKQKVSMQAGRDLWWHDFIAAADSYCPPQSLDSEHPLFLLYTSGSTGKPKGIVHTTAGYLLGTALSTKFIFDVKEDDIYWCTADIGWITGHSYCIYGPLALGLTTFMYEGAPSFPDWGRFWRMIAKYQITKFYTAPTAIRSFIKYGPQWPGKYDLSSLRLLGTVGEPINPEAWLWYQEQIGQNRCPIVDTWWQTETGAIMIAPLPGATTTKPGSATQAFWGIDAAVVDESGRELPANTGGYLVIKRPWPSMMRTIFKDHERYKSQYWEKIPGYYFTGDGARIDENGHFWIMGRIDDVLNVSGHRLSTMEIESALVAHEAVTEAAVVGIPDPVKGEAITCFVTLKENKLEGEELQAAISQHVVKQIGALARPDAIYFTEALPKTRSGKIMRRLLRHIAMGKELAGDMSTLENTQGLDKLIASCRKIRGML